MLTIKHNITHLLGCIPWEWVPTEHKYPSIPDVPFMGSAHTIYYDLFGKKLYIII